MISTRRARKAARRDGFPGQWGYISEQVVAGFGVLGLVKADDFVFLLNPETNGLVNHESDNAGYHESIGSGGGYGDDLGKELRGIAGDETGCADSCKGAGCNGTEGSADTVDPEGIEGVVILELGLHDNCQVTNEACANTDHQSPTRGNKTGSRSYGNQAGNDTGGKSEGARLTGVNPLSNHPGKAGRCRSNSRGGESQCSSSDWQPGHYRR